MITARNTTALWLAFLVAGMVVLAGFLTDVAYALLDPRVRFS